MTIQGLPFKTNADVLDVFRKYAMPTYDPGPVAFERGEGCRLWDIEGKSYLDFAAGVAVCSLGHAHPRIQKAVAEQADRVIHTSNLWLIPQAVELQRQLVHLTGLNRAFLCNSGTEAVEGALKLARYWGHKNGGRTDIIATNNSFHGRTMGALAVTGQERYHKGFAPLLPGVSFVPFGDAKAIADAITPKTCAVILEPVQGEGGVMVPPNDYLSDVRDLCDDKDILLILDEVQTGMGRTGTWFAYERAGIHPDIVALAKGMGGGFPIGAVVCNDRANAFEPGAHGSTFGGNHLAAAAALAVIETLRTDKVLENVRKQGQHLATHLATWEEAGKITKARGIGLLQGFELPMGGAKPFARKLLEKGLLVTSIGDRIIRLAPPLIVKASEVEEGLAILGDALGVQPYPVRRAA